MEGFRELKLLLQGAKATKYINYNWVSEVCEHLRKLADGSTEDGIRERVLEELRRVGEEFDRNVERWIAHGVGDGDLWQLYERLVEAAELLAERRDRLAVISFCAKAKAITFTAETIRKVAVLK